MIVSWYSLDLDQAIRERHSTRMFLPPRATGSSSVRRWPALSAYTGTSALRTPSV